jgi:hypothetical protein
MAVICLLPFENICIDATTTPPPRVFQLKKRDRKGRRRRMQQNVPFNGEHCILQQRLEGETRVLNVFATENSRFVKETNENGNRC